jgi:oxaloacetate decarboxylase alpha subunit
VKPAPAPAPAGGPEAFTVSVNGTSYDVVVAPGGAVTSLAASAPAATAPAAASVDAVDIVAPMAGSVIEILVGEGDVVMEDQPVVIIEAMKMETEVRATAAGTVQTIHAKKGDPIAVGQPLVSLG